MISLTISSAIQYVIFFICMFIAAKNDAFDPFGGSEISMLKSPINVSSIQFALFSLVVYLCVDLFSCYDILVIIVSYLHYTRQQPV